MYVKVYTTENCQPCRMTKVALQKYGVPFEEIPATDPETLQFLKDRGAREFPVVFAGGTFWTGFQPAKLKGLTPA